MDIESVSASYEGVTMLSEEGFKECADLKRRTQEVWQKRPSLEMTGTIKPQVHTLSWAIYDRAVDDKISEILKSAQFCRETVQYSYEGALYELVIIFNPEKRSLRKAVYETPITKTLIIDSLEPVPAPLKKHLEEICIQNSIEPADTILNLDYYGAWRSLRCLTIVNDPPVVPQDNKKAEEVIVLKSTEPQLAPAAPKTITTPIESKSAEPGVESVSRLRRLFGSLFG